MIDLAKAIRCDEANVESNWPIVRSALQAIGITDHYSLIAAAATIAVETGWRFAPVREIGSDAYLTRMYEGAQRLGNTVHGDGIKYCGRGFIQITGRANYQYYSHRLDVDLIGQPDIALDVHISAKILAQYFHDRKIPVAAAACDWPHVRKLVNGGLNGFTEFKAVVDTLLLSKEEL